jgi:hypothetical protein
MFILECSEGCFRVKIRPCDHEYHYHKKKDNMLIINKKKNVKTFWVGALFTGLLDPSKQIKFIDGLRSEI